ncbi:hypothetical protein [Cellulosimicrobium funkei]|uniref:Uncharacterized protein n=1 Tax=Cellulosimicrobium funkei TaxID=264251 RepID=A0A4Y8QXD7_9MICO|nr:hypothetical protein [Cellulosimicrobium funkei]TFF04416.1 hypothetical protein E1O70_18400 [Cellulosimicrobium funkei]TGA67919.1 hypothetical protein EQW79_018390 [Cellulosimicrobium terreum]
MNIPWTAIIAGIVPSIGVGLLFWLAMRAIVHADRNERRALAELDRQQVAETDPSPGYPPSAASDVTSQDVVDPPNNPHAHDHRGTS